VSRVSITTAKAFDKLMNKGGENVKIKFLKKITIQSIARQKQFGNASFSTLSEM
jgi:hypothetical protein